MEELLQCLPWSLGQHACVSMYWQVGIGKGGEIFVQEGACQYFIVKTVGDG